MNDTADFDQEWRAQSRRNFAVHTPEFICEFYDGENLVDWHSRRIRIQLYQLLKTYEGVNKDYEDAMRKFIEVWEANRLDGSVNVETVQALLAATEVEAARDWPLRNFFMNLESSLRSIIASEDKLPRIPKDSLEPPTALTNKKTVGKEVPSMFGPMKDKTGSPIGGVAEPQSTETAT